VLHLYLHSLVKLLDRQALVMVLLGTLRHKVGVVRQQRVDSSAELQEEDEDQVGEGRGDTKMVRQRLI